MKARSSAIETQSSTESLFSLYRQPSGYQDYQTLSGFPNGGNWGTDDYERPSAGALAMKDLIEMVDDELQQARTPQKAKRLSAEEAAEEYARLIDWGPFHAELPTRPTSSAEMPPQPWNIEINPAYQRRERNSLPMNWNSTKQAAPYTSFDSCSEPGSMTSSRRRSLQRPPMSRFHFAPACGQYLRHTPSRAKGKRKAEPLGMSLSEATSSTTSLSSVEW